MTHDDDNHETTWKEDIDSEESFYSQLSWIGRDEVPFFTSASRHQGRGGFLTIPKMFHTPLPIPHIAIVVTRTFLDRTGYDWKDAILNLSV